MKKAKFIKLTREELLLIKGGSEEEIERKYGSKLERGLIPNAEIKTSKRIMNLQKAQDTVRNAAIYQRGSRGNRCYVLKAGRIWYSNPTGLESRWQVKTVCEA